MPERLRISIQPVVFLVALAIAAAPLLAQGSYGLRLLTVAGIYAVLALGYQLIFGAAGALSLAQGAFFGIGAYVTGILGARHGMSAVLTLPLSIVVPVILAAVIAAPVLRLESHYFALATLGLAQLALLWAVNAEDWTGGANGISGVPALAMPGWRMALVVWIAAAIVAALAWSWSAGARGRALALMRDDPIAAEALGIDTGALRFAAFLFAASAAGLAGALHAHLLGVVSPEVLEFPVMVACLSMVVIGGRLHVAGAIIGALLLVQLPEWLRGIGAWYMVAYGGVLLAVIVFAPDGIMGGVAGLIAKYLPAMPRRLPAALRPNAIANGAALSLRGVGKHFGGVAALDHVTLDIGAGELVGIMGPNGSGKTTLINLVSGLNRTDAGEIRLDGASLARLPAHRIARLGVARGFQSPRLLDAMSALDNVAIGAQGAAHGNEAIALHWLEQMGAREIALQECGVLSGGARRRVEIARALAGNPRLLLLDEPAAGLTAEEQADLAARLSEINRAGLTMVVIEHEVPFLAGIASRLVCLVEGRIIADGKPAEVTRDPGVIAAYLGSAERRR